MKKPIKVAAYAAISIIPVTIVGIILAIMVFISTKSVYSILAFLIVIPSVILTYYGFVVVGAKLKIALLKFAGWYSIITIILSVVAIIGFIGYLQTSTYTSIQNISPADEQLVAAKNALNTNLGDYDLKNLSVNELVAQGLDQDKVINYKLALQNSQKQMPQSLDHIIDTLNSFPRGTSIILSFFLSILPSLLLAIGIYKLHKHGFKVAKTAGIIGIILASFNILFLIFQIIVTMQLTGGAAIGANIDSSFFVGIFSGYVLFVILSQLLMAAGIAYFVLEIVLLFNASEKLEHEHMIQDLTN